MQLRSALSSPATKKVILILHSQGGIEGSSILDWLLTDLSHTIIAKLEIFTFGNAARHFNNPLLSSLQYPPSSPSRSESHQSNAELGTTADSGRDARVIKYIEHYANSEDFVANIGVLNFTSPQAQPYAEGNTFWGPVFIREGSGHLLDMHYLDVMFRRVDGRVEDGNDFMDSLLGDSCEWKRERESDFNGDGTVNGNGHDAARHRRRRLKDVSRLWTYRNGGRPKC